MREPAEAALLAFDFDNTLTEGDVLDGIIERWSRDEAWRDWEHSWETGAISAEECLRRQVENLRVTRAALLEHLDGVRIDPAFIEILEWADARGIGTLILSDSFEPLIRHILRNNGLRELPVFANALAFDGDRLRPSFPYADPACTRSANAKARHLLPYRRHRIVFAGDGRSDLDAALAADVVFAKCSLAREMDALRLPYRPFETLQPMLAWLRSDFRAARPRRLRLV
jgi:2,3-diketo-5-methylthio-1-phosphopentane phosphatase